MKKGLVYYGGKQRLAPKIVPYLPPHTVYIEPFCGGCAVLFAKGRPEKRGNCYREVINDLDDLLITFYRELKSNPQLLERIKSTLYSRSMFKESLQILKNAKEYSNEDIALAYWIFINQTFSSSSILKNSWKTGVVNSNHASIFLNKKGQANSFVERIEEAYIECRDAVSVIKQWDSPQTCFYCDPPYIYANQGYRKKYSIDQYIELIDTLDGIQGSFVLSGYETEYEKQSWKKVEMKSYCSASSKGKTGEQKGRTKGQSGKVLEKLDRTECLWIKETSIDLVRKDRVKHLWSPSGGYVYRQSNRQGTLID
jgi:DNA adenine methylase